MEDRNLIIEVYPDIDVYSGRIVFYDLAKTKEYSYEEVPLYNLIFDEFGLAHNLKITVEVLE